MTGSGMEIDRLIEDAKHRVADEKQEQARQFAQRREAVMQRLKTAVAEQRIEDEQVVFTAAHRAQNLRISQAEALLDLIERGIWDEEPYWWDIKGAWSGYTRPGRRRLRICSSRNGKEFVLSEDCIDVGAVPVPVEITVRQTCQGKWVAILFPQKGRPIYKPSRLPERAAARAFISCFDPTGEGELDGDFSNISDKIKNMLDMVPVSPP